MPTLSIDTSFIKDLKSNLKIIFPESKSTHLLESISSSFGFKTYASLLSKLNETPDGKTVNLSPSEKNFKDRLKELDPNVFIPDQFELTRCVPTEVSSHPKDNVYNSPRKKAWRNMMVAAINEGLRQKRFSLKPGVNNWGDKSNYPKVRACVFAFNLTPNLPAKVIIFDAGWDELTIHVAINPTENFSGAWGQKFNAGDAIASGWLERRDGAWLQFSKKPTFSCRKEILEELASLNISPLGFHPSGKFKM